MDEIRIADSNPAKPKVSFYSGKYEKLIIIVIVLLTILILLNAIEEYYAEKKRLSDLAIAHLIAQTRPVQYNITPTELNAVFQENQAAQFREKLTEDDLWGMLFNTPQYSRETVRDIRVNIGRY